MATELLLQPTKVVLVALIPEVVEVHLVSKPMAVAQAALA